MRTNRLRRLAQASRPVLTILFIPLFASAAAAADTLTGRIVDATGRGVPRAHVRVLDQSGGEAARSFADETGRFEIVVADASRCRVEAALTGFRTSAVACTREPLRIELGLAPVQDSVLVTATRTDAPASQAGASASVFTAADLERRQMPLVADLLKLSPGAMIVRNGGPGGVTSLFMRGGESDHNKVLLDGIPLNEPGGIFFFNNLTTENLERVEVVRGAYSSLFGSDAMSSVVQLFTKRGTGGSRRPTVTGQFDGGTYATNHGSVGLSGAAGRLDYSLGAAQFNSDNRVPNSRLENTTLSANAGVALGPSASLRFIARGELEHVGTPGQTAFGRPDLDAFFDRQDAVVGVSFDHELSSRVRQRASYSLAVSDQISTNLAADPPYLATYQGRTATFTSSDRRFDTVTNLDRHYASYQADWRISRSASRGDHLLTVLADWHGERAHLQDRLADAEASPSRDNFGAAVQHQVLWPRVFVTVGGRIERNESFGTKAVPRATAVFVARRAGGGVGETLIKASVGKGIKEPTLLESFSLSFFARGNPDLKPERSRSAEVGIEQRLADDRAKMALTYFDNRFRDLIWTETTDFSTFAGQYFNLVGLSRARGLELGLDAAPSSFLGARAGYTFLDSTILESTAVTPVFENGAWAFRRPRHSGFLGVTARWQRLSVDISGVFTGRLVDNDFFLFDTPILEIPAQTTWDLRASVSLTSQVTALLMIDNLANSDYMLPVGYQQLGRVVRGGVRVAF